MLRDFPWQRSIPGNAKPPLGIHKPLLPSGGSAFPGGKTPYKVPLWFTITEKAYRFVFPGSKGIK